MTIRAKRQETSPSFGFAPVAGDDARILVLGSLPGQRSLSEGEYYAHPQNGFWRIMRELVGAAGTYEERCNALVENRIALWDVLASSIRRGSMDADIRAENAEVNDFSGFFRTHGHVRIIGFNGQKAAQLFARLVDEHLQDTIDRTIVLPSTSPAYASMSLAEKLDRWRSLLE